MKFLLAVVLFCSACVQTFSSGVDYSMSAARNVARGMTPAEVSRLMQAEPAVVSQVDDAIVWTFYYSITYVRGSQWSVDQRMFHVVFREGKVDKTTVQVSQPHG